MLKFECTAFCEWLEFVVANFEAKQVCETYCAAASFFVLWRYQQRWLVLHSSNLKIFLWVAQIKVKFVGQGQPGPCLRKGCWRVLERHWRKTCVNKTGFRNWTKIWLLLTDDFFLRSIVLCWFFAAAAAASSSTDHKNFRINDFRSKYFNHFNFCNAPQKVRIK